MHRSAAWPLTWMYCALVVYASLYPFADWRDQGIVPWSFLTAPLPRYWTAFDVAINVVGYLPLGALLTLGILRSGRTGSSIAFWLAVASTAGLSLLLESLQSYLPQRVASREDWLLNSLGAALGAALALYLARRGGLLHWDRWQRKWLAPQSRGVLVLLLSWPAALLFPAAIPFGLGHVWASVSEALMAAQAWGASWTGNGELGVLLPLATEAAPPRPALAFACVVTGILAPCLLGYGVVHSPSHRIWLSAGVLATGLSASGLSAALSWGPSHTWSWLDGLTLWGLATALVVALAFARMTWRWSAICALLVLLLHISLLNQAPQSPYFAQTLQAWEQGRFIRFNGLAEWLGWLWPYAAIAVVLTRLGHAAGEPKIAS